MTTVGGVKHYVSGGLQEIRRNWRVALRLSLAPPLAWWISMQIFEHNQAFFAPIAAILTLTVGVGKRATVLVEIIIGAALGVFVGELLILAIGRGVWQLVLIVALAVITSSFLRMSGLALTQATISGVLLVAIIPAPGVADPALTRFVDAFVGGFVALAMIIIIPANPGRDLARAHERILHEFASILDRIAESMRVFDAQMARDALMQARGTQPMVESVEAAAGSLSEMARLSPLRWRQRGIVAQQVRALEEMEHALRNTRVLARRVASLIRHEESVPEGLITALEDLAALARTNHDDAEALVEVARTAILAVSFELSINSASVASQIRAIVADMLLALGVEHGDLDEILDFD